MTGHICLYRGKGLLSSLIRWQTRGDYSHAALLLPGGTKVIESWPGVGVRFHTITDWSGIDVYSVHGLLSAQWDMALAFATRQERLQCPYDWRDDLRFLTRTKGGEPGKWFCSELVMASFARGGVKLLQRVEDWRVSPEMLATSPLLIPVRSSVSRFIKPILH